MRKVAKQHQCYLATTIKNQPGDNWEEKGTGKAKYEETISRLLKRPLCHKYFKYGMHISASLY